jgi:hypothetical protein
MHELEKLHCITYDSWMGYYVVHRPKGVVKFYKDKQSLLYLDLERPGQEAATMLLQRVQSEQGNDKGGQIETAIV